jgi:hypothetical protein
MVSYRLWSLLKSAHRARRLGVFLMLPGVVIKHDVVVRLHGWLSFEFQRSFSSKRNADCRNTRSLPNLPGLS